MDRLILSIADVDALAYKASRFIVQPDDRPARVYAVPRGGIPAALAIGRYVHFEFVEHPSDADYIVDDMIDSGATMQRVLADAIRRPPGRAYMGNHEPVVVTLINKRAGDYPGVWIVWPWEGDSGGSFEDNIRRTLQFVGEDVSREGLRDTPIRVAKAWEFWCKGYRENPADILKTFEDGAEKADEMVMVRDIPFYTHCEHHMAPFFGKATIAYIPNGRIVGLSKLNRLVDCFARRLQVQERLTTQVADALMTHLQPKGVGVIITARHMCMESRGVCQQGHSTVTSALRGVMSDGTVRQEFLQLAK